MHAFLTILVLSIANIAHDHTYASKTIGAENQTTFLQDTTTRESSKVKENDDGGEHTECYRSDYGTPAIMKEKLRYACLVSNIKIWRGSPESEVMKVCGTVQEGTGL